MSDYKYICIIQERVKDLIRKWRKERADIFKKWNVDNSSRIRNTYILYIIVTLLQLFECYIILLYGSQYPKDTNHFLIDSLQYILVNCFITQV